MSKKSANQLSTTKLKLKQVRYTAFMILSIVFLSVILLLGLYFYLTGFDISWITFGVLCFILFFLAITFNLMRLTVEREIAKKKKK